jgi:hypothetical protein
MCRLTKVSFLVIIIAATRLMKGVAIIRVVCPNPYALSKSEDFTKMPNSEPGAQTDLEDPLKGHGCCLESGGLNRRFKTFTSGLTNAE